MAINTRRDLERYFNRYLYPNSFIKPINTQFASRYGEINSHNIDRLLYALGVRHNDRTNKFSVDDVYRMMTEHPDIVGEKIRNINNVNEQIYGKDKMLLTEEENVENLDGVYPHVFAQKMRIITNETLRWNKANKHRFNEFIKERQVPRFFSKHTQLAYLLKSPKLTDFNKLVYKDSYYFPIKMNHGKYIGMDGYLRVSNHKVNFTTLCKETKTTKKHIYVFSVVLDYTEIDKPETKVNKKIFSDEIIFDDNCDLETIFKTLEPFVKGNETYNMREGILGLKPTYRTTYNELRTNDLDQKIYDLRHELNQPSEVPNKAEEVQNVEPSSNEEVLPQKTTVMSRSERNRQTRQRNKEEMARKQAEEEEKRQKAEQFRQEQDAQHIVEYETENGELKNFYLDTKEYPIEELCKFTSKIGVYNKTLYMLPNKTMVSKTPIPMWGVYNVFVNGRPYCKVKTNVVTDNDGKKQIGFQYLGKPDMNEMLMEYLLLHKLIINEIKKIL